MLQVTFRQTLPNESLVALAQALFAEWSAAQAAEEGSVRCHVIIDGEDVPPRRHGAFRVRVDVEPGSRRALRTTFQDRDAARALSIGMQAARSAWTSSRSASRGERRCGRARSARPSEGLEA